MTKKKKKRKKMKNGIARFLRSPAGPKGKIIQDKRRKALDELVALSQELGMYD